LPEDLPWFAPELVLRPLVLAVGVAGAPLAPPWEGDEIVLFAAESLGWDLLSVFAGFMFPLEWEFAKSGRTRRVSWVRFPAEMSTVAVDEEWVRLSTDVVYLPSRRATE
jgi:hypothetical protein